MTHLLRAAFASRLVCLASLSLAFAACASSHGLPSSGWQNCGDAVVHGRSGDPCSFSGSCSSAGTGYCTCRTLASCDGTLHVDHVCPTCDGGVGQDAGHDGGVPRDAGPAWRSCGDALAHGRDGDACAFSDTCGQSGTGFCACSVQASCDGTLHLDTACPTCDAGAPTGWRTCDLFRTEGGNPGDPCDPSSFMPCANGRVCCDTYVCDPTTATVIVRPVECASVCVPLMNLCPGTMPPDPSAMLCRSSADCGGPLCLPPGASAGCGPCRMPEHDCTADPDCAPGDVCVSTVLACTCTGEPSTLCGPSCTGGGTTCAAGERCDPSGHCVALSCATGYACGSNTRCDVGAPGADEHGCVRQTCTVDAECDCGACVEGRCYDGPGQCTYPPPVPAAGA